ncbi:MAG TPA: extracellular solute-binding protein, partial [Devosia sp.]|nr:extracellular solute-binding protein [Devosia sp.]
MLRRHLLMAGTAIALTAAMVGSAMAQATVVRIVAGDLVPDDPASENYIKAIEDGVKAMDGTEIDLQIVPIAASSYADKLSALLLGGDIPDLIYFQGGDQKMVEQGILADLNPLIENTQFLKNELYGHNVERMKNFPYLVYNFPPRAPQPVIRTDWLEELGMEPPDTVDEYTALFQAIHDADLDGDGTPGNTLGLTAYVNTAELDNIFNQAFGV